MFYLFNVCSVRENHAGVSGKLVNTCMDRVIASIHIIILKFECITLWQCYAKSV